MIKNKNGITLIALVITIIVMLTLATVSFFAIVGENGLITKTQKAKENSRGSSVQEEVDVYKTNYKIAIDMNTLPKKTKLDKIDEMKSKNLITEEEANALKKDETIQIGDFSISMLLEETEPIVISITLDKTSITKEIISGSTGTETLTANLKNASGELSWISSDTSVAEISGEGNTRTITLKKAGTATITVSYETESAMCEITVTEKESVKIGDYIYFDVPYTDVENSNVYNAYNGWLLIDNRDGCLKLMSTGIPLKYKTGNVISYALTDITTGIFDVKHDEDTSASYGYWVSSGFSSKDLSSEFSKMESIIDTYEAGDIYTDDVTNYYTSKKTPAKSNQYKVRAVNLSDLNMARNLENNTTYSLTSTSTFANNRSFYKPSTTILLASGCGVGYDFMKAMYTGGSVSIAGYNSSYGIRPIVELKTTLNLDNAKKIYDATTNAYCWKLE